MWPALLSAGIQVGAQLLPSLIPQSGRHARMQQIIDNMNAIRLQEAQAENDARIAQYNANAAQAAALAAATPQVTTSSVDLASLVSQSQSAGFNPLTVLRAGGLSLYARQTTTGHNALGAAQLSLGQVNRFEPILLRDAPKRTSPQIGDVLGKALSAGGSAFMSQLNADRNFGLQERALAEQVSAMSLNRRGGGLLNASVGARTTARARLRNPVISRDDDTDSPGFFDESNKPTMTTPFHPATGLVRDRRFGDQENYETAYGDVAGEVFGTIGIGLDAYKNVFGKEFLAGTYWRKALQREDVGIPFGQPGFRRGFQDRPVVESIAPSERASYLSTINNKLNQWDSKLWSYVPGVRSNPLTW